ncbi:hypothetical protein BH20ACI1_BH20ACI1_06170 [soil metagenome]
MFCQKCGTKNPDNGKFCRSCGTDLSPVSDALSGKSKNKLSDFGMMQPIEPMMLNRKGKLLSWESALSTLFGGIAFIAVTIALANSVIGTGWWFWMLIPALTMIGTGLAQIIQIRRNEKNIISVMSAETQNVLREESKAELPPSQNDYIAPDLRYKTGDLVPPSVTEGTTQHLEMDSEGETMTLPKTESKRN